MPLIFSKVVFCWIAIHLIVSLQAVTRLPLLHLYQPLGHARNCQWDASSLLYLMKKVRSRWEDLHTTKIAQALVTTFLNLCVRSILDVFVGQ